MQNTIALVDDPLFDLHEAPGGEAHPERPERLQAARRGVARAVLPLKRHSLPARDATDDELALVHTREYISDLGRIARTSGYLDGDTYFGEQSVDAARRAVGGALALVDALLGGEIALGVGLLRPPGHHATPERGMGFCLLNNVAVAAKHALAGGARRVMIVDWDVHHGNGTEDAFYEDDRVLYASIHQYPLFPGSGGVDSVGRGPGVGRTLNIPLSEGATDAAYAAAFERSLAPACEAFAPDLLLVSAGFDAHMRDPLAAMQLSDEAYFDMARRLARAMPNGGRGRTALLLEGGYDVVAVERSLARSLEGLVSGEPPPSGAGRQIAAAHEQELERAVASSARWWPTRPR